MYIYFDIKLSCIEGKPKVKQLLCFPVSHWLKFDDSVLDSAYD